MAIKWKPASEKELADRGIKPVKKEPAEKKPAKKATAKKG